MKVILIDAGEVMQKAVDMPAMPVVGMFLQLKGFDDAVKVVSVWWDEDTSIVECFCKSDTWPCEDVTAANGWTRR